METKEYTTIDRAKWPSGEWDSEPDKVQWPDEATGLPCLAVRHPSSGHWCGYVGVAEGHPYFGKHYGDLNVEVHGGLTFSAERNAVVTKPLTPRQLVLVNYLCWPICSIQYVVVYEHPWA